MTEGLVQKGKMSYYLVTLMLMEGQVKFHSLQNIFSGSSQQNLSAAFS